MPNKRAAHIGQVSLAIDKKIIRQVDKVAKHSGYSRNRTIEKILFDQLPSYLKEIRTDD